MKLLKIILIFFIFYFIRRFMQLYKVMKEIQANQIKDTSKNLQNDNGRGVVDADYKVIKDT